MTLDLNDTGTLSSERYDCAQSSPTASLAPRMAVIHYGKARTETKTAKVNGKAEKKKAKRAKKLGYAGRDMDVVLSEGERQRILAEEIKKLTGWSTPWSVRERGATWEHLVDPAGDPIGTGGTVAAVATLGLSLAATPVRRGRNNDKHLNIEVLPNGTIERTGSLIYGGTDYSNVPKLKG